MEYYAALKKKIHIDEPWGHYAEWSEPVTKGQILYDPTPMKYLK